MKGVGDVGACRQPHCQSGIFRSRNYGTRSWAHCLAAQLFKSGDCRLNVCPGHQESQRADLAARLMCLVQFERRGRDWEPRESRIAARSKSNSHGANAAQSSIPLYLIKSPKVMLLIDADNVSADVIEQAVQRTLDRARRGAPAPRLLQCRDGAEAAGAVQAAVGAADGQPVGRQEQHRHRAGGRRHRRWRSPSGPTWWCWCRPTPTSRRW